MGKNKQTKKQTKTYKDLGPAFHGNLAAQVIFFLFLFFTQRARFGTHCAPGITLLDGLFICLFVYLSGK